MYLTVIVTWQSHKFVFRYRDPQLNVTENMNLRRPWPGADSLLGQCWVLWYTMWMDGKYGEVNTNFNKVTCYVIMVVPSLRIFCLWTIAPIIIYIGGSPSMAVKFKKLYNISNNFVLFRKLVWFRIHSFNALLSLGFLKMLSSIASQNQISLLRNVEYNAFKILQTY